MTKISKPQNSFLIQDGDRIYLVLVGSFDIMNAQTITPTVQYYVARIIKNSCRKTS